MSKEKYKYQNEAQFNLNNKKGITITQEPKYKREGLEYNKDENQLPTGQFKAGNKAAALSKGGHNSQAESRLMIIELKAVLRDKDHKNRLVAIVDSTLKKAEKGHKYYEELYTKLGIEILMDDIKQKKVATIDLNNNEIKINLPIMGNNKKKVESEIIDDNNNEE